MSSRGRDLLKLSSIIVVAFGLGIAFASALDLPRPGRAEQSPRARPLLTGQPVAVRGDGVALPSFADVADAVKPAVVFIRSEHRARPHAQRQGIPRGVPGLLPPAAAAGRSRRGVGLRLHRLRGRLHPHQQPRGGRRRPGHASRSLDDREFTAQGGRRATRRPTSRSSRSTPSHLPAAAARQLRRRAGGRVGARHRQPARASSSP